MPAKVSYILRAEAQRLQEFERLLQTGCNQEIPLGRQAAGKKLEGGTGLEVGFEVPAAIVNSYRSASRPEGCATVGIRLPDHYATDCASGRAASKKVRRDARAQAVNALWLRLLWPKLFPIDDQGWDDPDRSGLRSC